VGEGGDLHRIFGSCHGVRPSLSYPSKHRGAALPAGESLCFRGLLGSGNGMRGLRPCRLWLQTCHAQRLTACVSCRSGLAWNAECRAMGPDSAPGCACFVPALARHATSTPCRPTRKWGSLRCTGVRVASRSAQSMPRRAPRTPVPSPEQSKPESCRCCVRAGPRRGRRPRSTAGRHSFASEPAMPSAAGSLPLRGRGGPCCHDGVRGPRWVAAEQPGQDTPRETAGRPIPGRSKEWPGRAPTALRRDDHHSRAVPGAVRGGRPPRLGGSARAPPGTALDRSLGTDPRPQGGGRSSCRRPLRRPARRGDCPGPRAAQSRAGPPPTSSARGAPVAGRATNVRHIGRLAHTTPVAHGRALRGGRAASGRKVRP